MEEVNFLLHTIILYFYYAIFLEFANSQNIAIDVARKTVIHGEEDLVITCSLLRYSELLKVDSIRLLRNSSGGSEQVMGTLTDTQRPLPTQIPGVRVTGSLRPLWSAKLSFTLAKEFVDCQNERAGYMCSLTGMDQSFIPVQQFTEQVPVDVAVKCNSQKREPTACLYKQTHSEVIVIGITVAIAIVAIGAGVNFAVWKKYHNVLKNHMKHTERRQSQIAKQETESTLKRERPHYSELDIPEQEQNTYDVLNPYIEPVSHGH